jgi:mannan endo-1,4-beta-mannosidase
MRSPGRPPRRSLWVQGGEALLVVALVAEVAFLGTGNAASAGALRGLGRLPAVGTWHPTTSTTTTTTSGPGPGPKAGTGAAPGSAAASTTSTTTPAATTTTITPPSGVPVIQVSDGALTLGGRPYEFVGVNAYEIGTMWGTNAGCGPMETDAQLDQLFSTLPPDSLVRFWAFEATIAIDQSTRLLDWAPLDRVFAAAARYHQRLVPVLAGQGSGCDGGHWQDVSWYDGGFQTVFDDPSTTDGRGLTPLSYWAYLQAVVQRYRSSPALGMWEPMSEAEASTCPPQYEPTGCQGHQTCPDEATAAQALRHFYDVVGAEIRALDPVHLVEDGLLGGGQCGTAGADYGFVTASPGIDVASYHDYYGGAPMGGDQWNGIAVRIAQAKAAGKPIVAGEMGITAGTASGCTALQDRTSQIRSKVSAQLTAGSSGALVWDWMPSPTSPCTFDTFPGDPLLGLLAQGAAAL